MISSARGHECLAMILNQGNVIMKGNAIMKRLAKVTLLTVLLAAMWAVSSYETGKSNRPIVIVSYCWRF